MSAVEPIVGPPSLDLHFEDVVVGTVVPFGRTQVTAAEIMEFGRTFDPQPAHVSEEAAAGSRIGRLIASGYHTCCIMMRLLVDNIFGGPGSQGSPGLDEARFLKPVLPGDVLTATYLCSEKRPLKSKPGVGMCRFHFEMLNGRGETVMTWDCVNFLRLRHPEREGR